MRQPITPEAIVEKIREILWLDHDDSWNPDKEWDSETIECIARVLTQSGRGPRDKQDR